MAPSSKPYKHRGKVAFLVIVGVLGGVYYLYQHVAPKIRTDQRVKHHARLLCHPPDKGFRKGVDGWGVTLKYVTEEIEDPYATKCTVTSAGRDGEFGTEDDIVAVNHDYHKTKIVAESLKNGAKSLWKSIIE